jgi:hypothetical protein
MGSLQNDWKIKAMVICNWIICNYVLTIITGENVMFVMLKLDNYKNMKMYY